MAAWILLGLMHVGCCESAWSQNLLVNGSFEWPKMEAAEFTGVSSFREGDTNLIGWSVSGPGSAYVVLPATNRLAAFEGSQYADFNRTTLSQSFPTIAGEPYEVTFRVGRFQFDRPLQLHATILSDDGEILAEAMASAPLDPGWAEPTVVCFVAETMSTSLCFTNANADSDIDLVLDDVMVQRLTPRLSIECSQIRICWNAETNHTYQLQSRAEAATGEWINLGAPLEGTGRRECSLQQVEEGRRFYRVMVTP